MSDFESMCNDAQYEEAECNYINNILENTDALEEKNFEIRCNEVINLYGIENYWEKETAWKGLTTKEKLDYCKQLLFPITTDDFALQRQISVFQNLINLNLEELNYYHILECAFYNENKTTEEKTIKINPLIPKKHYITYIKDIYSSSAISSLQIPTKNSTQFLQELFQIWFMNKVDSLTPYEISSTIYSYHGKVYEPKQIKRKLSAIAKLIK